MGYIPHWRDSTYSVRIRSASTVSMYGALSRETKLFSLITETQLHKSYRIRAQLIFVFLLLLLLLLCLMRTEFCWSLRLQKLQWRKLCRTQYPGQVTTFKKCVHKHRTSYVFDKYHLHDYKACHQEELEVSYTRHLNLTHHPHKL